ncbi:MAG TPA: zinc-dependent alcohol dehydrogenase family protein [Streptosporangiaceae bacterium]|jgi:2-desacetyl-2-hydroxyethyl bacteriochlorophyllide A dehydrogenase
MRAVVIDKPGAFRIGEVADPEPGPHDVVVRVAACGICGTDLHILDGEFPPSPYPLVPGHEFAGTIAAVGSGVRGLAEGQRVACDPSLFCGRCDYCRIGRGNLCANWNAVGDTVSGAFAEYVAVPEANTYAIPDGLDFASAALIEPLSCAVHGVDMLGGVADQRVLVIGAGTMGLLLAQLLRNGGAAEVAVVDREAARLDLAARVGATTVATDVEAVRGAGFHTAVDATGAVPAIGAAFDSLRRGGTLLVFGVADGEAKVELSPFRIYNDEIRVLGSMAVLNSYGRAVEIASAGRVDLGALIAPAWPLDGYGAAVAAVRSGNVAEGRVKAQVVPGT